MREQMTDLISRQAAIDALSCENPTEIYVFYDDAVKAIKKLPAAQPGIVRCKECKHFHYDMPYVMQGIPILGHEVCDFWGDGCKTNENGFCHMAERECER